MQTLPFASLNGSYSKTILLLHGGGSSAKEWNGVIQHLGGYHLLLPDLHQSAASLADWSFASIAARLSHLIEKQAHGGQVDCVGLSMGGYLSIFLAANYPHLIRNVFASGCHHSFTYYRSMGLLIGIDGFFQRIVPKWVFVLVAERFLGLQNGEDLYVEAHTNTPAVGPFKLGQLIARALGTEIPEEVWEKVQSRTLLVAGGKEFSLSRMKINTAWLQKGNSKSKGAVVPGQGHPWNQQDPARFAQGIQAWIEGTPLPQEYNLFR